MNKHIFSFFLFLSLVGLAACSNDDIDLTAPEMEVVTFAPTPVADDICGTEEPTVFQLMGGDQLSFDVIFKDDVDLSQYKIDIHNNFDCHGHGGGSAPSVAVPNVANLTTDWAVLEIQDIEGTSAPILETLEVPLNVTTGNYHFQIQVIDKSGNDNPAANFFALKINNPIDQTAPEITLEKPLNNNFSIKKGEEMQFTGQVTD
ncbi:MAG: DUF4625 domain-containing protein, partial [Saprospiraceae bacterium]